MYLLNNLSLLSKRCSFCHQHVLGRLGWSCSVSEKSNVIQVKSSQLSVASMAFGELPRLRAHQTADASGRSPARGRHARPHPRPTSWLPHMAHGTRPDRKDVNVRTRITWGRAGARPLTSTDHVSPHGGPHCPHPFPFFDFARYFVYQLTNMFSPCTRRVAGRRASRPASPGSSALRRLLILEETEKLGVQSAAVNGCRLTIQNRPRRKRSTSIVHRRSRTSRDSRPGRTARSHATHVRFVVSTMGQLTTV